MTCVTELQAAGAVVAMVGDGERCAGAGPGPGFHAMGGGAQLARTSRISCCWENPTTCAMASSGQKTLRASSIRTCGGPLRTILCPLPLAITGHVTPWLAGIGMSASSLLVVPQLVAHPAPGDLTDGKCFTY